MNPVRLIAFSLAALFSGVLSAQVPRMVTQTFTLADTPARYSDFPAAQSADPWHPREDHRDV
jgi:hypothetical protein